MLVPKPQAGTDLPQEALALDLVRGASFEKDLERDTITAPDADRGDHRAHVTDAEDPLDAILTGDDVTGLNRGRLHDSPRMILTADRAARCHFRASVQRCRECQKRRGPRTGEV